MNKKALFISLGATLVLASSGGAGAYWWYTNQPEQRLARAQELLAANDTAAATTILTDLAAQGCPEADQQLAQLHAQGNITAPDDTTAARWWSLLAEQGHEQALREMAKRCEEGRGVEQNTARAMEYYRRLADKGHTDAMRILADAYARGQGVEKNPAEAIKLYEKVLAPNDAEGHYALALCHRETGDAAKARQFIAKAATLGCVEAQIEEACRLYDAKDYAKAYPMLQAAAEAGDIPAAARLALCYKFALGGPRHAALAAKWEEAAKAGGIDPASLPHPVPVLVKAAGALPSPGAEELRAAEQQAYAAPAGGHHPLTKNLYGGAQIELPAALYTQLEAENRQLREKLPPAEYMQLLRGEQLWWDIYQMALRHPDRYETNLHGESIRDYDKRPGKVGSVPALKSLLQRLVQDPENDVLFPRVKNAATTPTGISYRETPQNSSDIFTYGDEHVLASQRPAEASPAAKALPPDSYWNPGIIHTFWDTRTGEPLTSTRHYSTAIYIQRRQDGSYAMRTPAETQRRDHHGGNTLAGIPLGVDSHITPHSGLTGTPGTPARQETFFSRPEDSCTEETFKKYRQSSASQVFGLTFGGPGDGEGTVYIESKNFFSQFICGRSMFSYAGNKVNRWYDHTPTAFTLTAVDLSRLTHDNTAISFMQNNLEYEERYKKEKETIRAAFARTLIRPIALEIKHNEEFLNKQLGMPIQMTRGSLMSPDQPVIIDSITVSRGSKSTIAFELHANNDNEMGESEYIASGAHYIGVWHGGKAWLLTAPEPTDDQGHGALQGEGALVPLEEEKKQSTRDPKLLSWPCRSFLHVQDGEDGHSATLMIGAASTPSPEGAPYKGVQQVHIDFNTGTVRYLKHWEFTQQNLSLDPLWLEDQHLLLLPENNHTYRIIKTDADAANDEIGKLYVSVNDGYAIVLNNGLYAGSPGCETLLQFGDGYRTINMQALAPWRNRPAEVLQALGGNPDDVEALRQSTNRWLKQMGYSPEAMGQEPKIHELPYVAVEMPELHAREHNVRFLVHMQATANDIARLEVLHNGVRLPQELENAPTTVGYRAHTVTAQLAEGTNWFEVTAIDCYGYRSNTRRFRVMSSAKTPPGKLYMVALGVSQYDQPELNLQYAAKDAGDLAAAFQQFHAGDTETLVLRDAEVKDAAVLERVREFISRAEPQDRVILYLAGHGMLDEKLEYHYAPASFDAENVTGTGISMQSLLDTIDSTRALTRLLLLDTCHAGILSEADADKMALAMGNLPQGVRAIQHRGMKVKQVESSLSSTQKKRYIDEIFSTGNTRRGISVLAGAAGAEFALESGEWKNGVFTATLIEALNGGLPADKNQDGQINVAELYQAVVTAVSERTNGAQRPNTSMLENNGEQVIAHSLGNFILKKDWATVENMVSQGYRLSSTITPGDPDWLAFAAENGAPSHIRELLLRAGATVDIEALLYWDIPHEDKVKLLTLTLEAGNRHNIDEALINAVANPQDTRNDFVKLLLKHGANVNAFSKRKETALMKATTEERVRLLLEHGADETLSNVYAHNPYMMGLILEMKGQTALKQARLSTYELVSTLSNINNRDNSVYYILNKCTPIVQTPNGELKREELWSQPHHQHPWKEHQSKIIGVARNGNDIEVLTQYFDHHHETNHNTVKTIGYELLHGQFDEAGRLYAWSSTTSHDATLTFSANMQEQPNWEPENLWLLPLPTITSGPAPYAGDICLKLEEGKQFVRQFLEQYVQGDASAYIREHCEDNMLNLTDGSPLNHESLSTLAQKNKAVLGAFDIDGVSYNFFGHLIQIEMKYKLTRVLSAFDERHIRILLSPNGKITAISDTVEYLKSMQLYHPKPLTIHSNSLENGPTLAKQTRGMSAAQIREWGVDCAEGRRGKPRDEIKAVQLYILAALENDVPAARWMGWRYRQGNGVPKDEDMARRYFSMAAHWGDEEAAKALGMDLSSTSINRDSITAAEFREKGVDYAEGRNGKPKDEKRAIELYTYAAEKGDIKAQRWMGWRYRQGRGVPKDEQKARYYFGLAAQQGDQAAAEAIGVSPGASSSASSGSRNSGTSGMSAAQVRELGVDYAEARNGKYKDEQKAIQLYIQAADMGDIKAQRWMGWRYRQGRGVPKDEQRALMYFRKAANQGDKAAADALRMKP
ncbi:MAG: SEL1-like repeat protein [Akkermansia sp.]|nr:SEL1-like repeat protein [Akkermansia sp.]